MTTTAEDIQRLLDSRIAKNRYAAHDADIRRVVREHQLRQDVDRIWDLLAEKIGKITPPDLTK